MYKSLPSFILSRGSSQISKVRLVMQRILNNLMKGIALSLLLSLSAMAESSIDEFTKQEIPASGKGVPKVVLSGNQVKNIQYAEVDGKPLLLDLY
ncbi:MAG TPA: hypothetical protein DD662_12835, partial [Planctomycetaceae bacterium]|nr:hypothetical protein [Planctomycetaceae bacterium]